MASGKQYGLILPKSKGGSGLSAPSNKARARGGVASAFGEDDSSSEGEEMCTDWMKKKLESTNQPKKKPTTETAEDEAARHAAGFSSGIKRGLKIR